MHYYVSDYLTDLIQNSIEAAASVIIIELNNICDEMEILISDNGKGMDENTLKLAKEPFYTEVDKHSNRRVGLGLPFIIQAIESIGGYFDIKSNTEIGTSIAMKYQIDNIDAPPMGSIVEMLLGVLSMDGSQEIIFTRTQGSKSYQIKRSELIEIVGSLDKVSSLDLLKRYLEGLEEDIALCECKETCKT